jgi:hypothetical protein
LYEEHYCARGDMENRIKEQLMLFSDRTSTHYLRSNQLRLYFSTIFSLLKLASSSDLGSSATKSTSQSEQWLKPGRYSDLHSGQNISDELQSTITNEEDAFPWLGPDKRRSRRDVHVDQLTLLGTRLEIGLHACWLPTTRN